MKRQTLLMPCGDDRGWTVVELMVVLLIIAILLAIAIAVYTSATEAANGAVCRENQQIMNRAIPVSRASGAEIDEINDLATCIVNFEKASKCPSDGTPLQYQAATDTVTCPNHP